MIMKKKMVARVLATMLAATATAGTAGSALPLMSMTVMQVMAEESAPESALKKISVSGVEDGAEVTAYQLVKGVYSNGKLEKYVLTDLGSGIKVGSYGDNTTFDNGADEVTIDDLVVFDASKYKPVDGLTMEKFGQVYSDGTRYAVKQTVDGKDAWYRAAVRKDADGNATVYVTSSIDTEFTNFLAEYTGKAANKIQTGTYTGTGFTKGTESGGTYTYESSEAVEPGLYIVLVKNSSSGMIYNPVLVAVNVNNADDLSTGVSTTTVSLNDTFKNGSLTAYTKKSSTGFEKNITNVKHFGDDESAGIEDNGDAVAFGDVVEFELSGMTIPSYSKDYEEVEYEITDTLEEKAFGEIEDLEVTVGDTKVYYKGTDGGYKCSDGLKTIENKYDNGKATLKIAFTDKFIREHGNQEVKVTYKSRLLTNAGLNFAENVNHAELKYSNDPADKSKTDTKKANTYHYTFGIDANIDSEAKEDGDKWETHELNKITGESGESGFTETTTTYSNTGATSTKIGKALQGAEFALYTDKECKTPVSRYEYTYKESGSDGAGVYQTVNPVELKATSDANGHISFLGLDEGIYYMKETKAPDGYTISTTVYQIVIDANFNDDGTLKDYSIVTTNMDSNKVVGNAKYTATYEGAADADGSVTPKVDAATTIKPVEITNLKNQTLPFTGGEGRFAIYFGSAALAGMVGILAVCKKKNDKEEA